MSMLTVQQASELTGWPVEVLYEAMVLDELSWKRANDRPHVSEKMLERWIENYAPYEAISSVDMPQSVTELMAWVRQNKNPQQPQRAEGG